MDKAPDAYRTISEVADDLDIAQHVLRFWETKFPQIKPLKRGGGRRYYRPDDVELVTGIRHLLYKEGYTIKGVQRILKEQGPRAVMVPAAPPPQLAVLAPAPAPAPVRQPIARFQEPDPLPYVSALEPVWHPAPEAVTVPPREMLFDLPELRKGGSPAIPTELSPVRDTVLSGKAGQVSQPGQVSMVRGGLAAASGAALASPALGDVQRSVDTQTLAMPLEQPAPVRFTEKTGRAMLAEALGELEAIRSGLASLLEQRPG